MHVHGVQGGAISIYVEGEAYGPTVKPRVLEFNITSCDISDNRAIGSHTYGKGGAVAIHSNHAPIGLYLMKTTIRANIASFKGGGLYIYHRNVEAMDSSTITDINTCSIRGNVAGEGYPSRRNMEDWAYGEEGGRPSGGGLFYHVKSHNDEATDKAALVSNTVIEGNRATTFLTLVLGVTVDEDSCYAAAGGGVHVEHGAAIFENGTRLLANSARPNAGCSTCWRASTRSASECNEHGGNLLVGVDGTVCARAETYVELCGALTASLEHLQADLS